MVGLVLMAASSAALAADSAMTNAPPSSDAIHTNYRPSLPPPDPMMTFRVACASLEDREAVMHTEQGVKAQPTPAERRRGQVETLAGWCGSCSAVCFRGRSSSS